MRSNGQKRSGAAAVEFAFVFLPVFVIFFSFIEHGRYFMVLDLMQNAAREGARYAAVISNSGEVDDANTVTDTAIKKQKIIDWVDYWMLNQDLNLTDYTVKLYASSLEGVAGVTGEDSPDSWRNLSYGDMLTVKITGGHKVILPILTMLPATMNMDVRAVSVAEGN